MDGCKKLIIFPAFVKGSMRQENRTDDRQRIENKGWPGFAVGRARDGVISLSGVSGAN